MLNPEWPRTGGISMNSLKCYLIIGVLFVFVTGTLSHFVYGWTGNNGVVGLFFPINESTWEHMKLIIFPMLVYGVFLNWRCKEKYPQITSALSAGLLFGTLLIPVLFYTYSGALGFNLAVVDIAIFFVSVLLAFLAVYRLTLSAKALPYTALLSILVMIFLLLFLLFTYFPPQIALFQDMSQS